MLTLGLVLAATIGLSLGMLGGGGSILTVPVLVYVLGVEAKPAIAMSLAVVGATSLIGAALHWRLGNLRVGVAVPFGLLTMVGAFAGAKLATFLSGTAQLALLAIVILVAAGVDAARRRVDVDAERRRRDRCCSCPRDSASVSSRAWWASAAASSWCPRSWSSRACRCDRRSARRCS